MASRPHVLARFHSIADTRDQAIAAIASVTDQPVDQLITQMDGSMIPVMQPGTGKDARQGRHLFWREVRLCSALASEFFHGDAATSIKQSAHNSDKRAFYLATLH